MEPITKGLEVWQAAGFAGLFVVVFLAMCVFLYRRDTQREKHINELHDKWEEMLESTVKALQESTQAARDGTETIEELKKSLDENTKQSAECLTYIRSRDEFFGKGGRRG